jgi:hypothetical protein
MFFAQANLDHDPLSYSFYVAEMTGMNHHHT